jgi:hypothetical protein
VPIFGIKVCSSILSFDIEYNLCGNDYIKMWVKYKRYVSAQLMKISFNMNV